MFMQTIFFHTVSPAERLHRKTAGAHMPQQAPEA
jgi:hypothetical protein